MPTHNRHQPDTVNSRRAVRHYSHVSERLKLRYNLDATQEELIEVEDAINTLDPIKDFYRMNGGAQGTALEWRGQLIHWVISCRSRNAQRRHILTVYKL